MVALVRTEDPIVTALGVSAHLEEFGFAPMRITGGGTLVPVH